MGYMQATTAGRRERSTDERYLVLFLLMFAAAMVAWAIAFAILIWLPVVKRLNLLSHAVLDSSTLSFGDVPVGGSKALELELTNPDETVQRIVSIDESDSDRGFAVHHDCVAVQPHATCTIAVQFRPRSAKAYEGVLTVHFGTHQQTVSLTGAGVPFAAKLTVRPGDVTFPDQVVETSSAPFSLTLQNASAAPVALTKVSTTGDFAVQGECTQRQQLAVRDPCTIAITFRPGSAGKRIGTLVVETSMGNKTVPLTGNGIPAETPKPDGSGGSSSSSTSSTSSGSSEVQ